MNLHGWGWRERRPAGWDGSLNSSRFSSPAGRVPIYKRDQVARRFIKWDCLTQLVIHALDWLWHIPSIKVDRWNKPVDVGLERKSILLISSPVQISNNTIASLPDWVGSMGGSYVTRMAVYLCTYQYLSMEDTQRTEVCMHIYVQGQ